MVFLRAAGLCDERPVFAGPRVRRAAGVAPTARVATAVLVRNNVGDRCGYRSRRIRHPECRARRAYRHARCGGHVELVPRVAGSAVVVLGALVVQCHVSVLALAAVGGAFRSVQVKAFVAGLAVCIRAPVHGLVVNAVGAAGFELPAQVFEKHKPRLARAAVVYFATRADGDQGPVCARAAVGQARGLHAFYFGSLVRNPRVNREGVPAVVVAGRAVVLREPFGNGLQRAVGALPGVPQEGSGS